MGDGAPGPLLGRGNAADVHAHGAHALKLLHAGRPAASAFREAAHLAMLAGSGLPVPEVLQVGRFGDRWGLVLTRAEEGCDADLWVRDPREAPARLQALAALQARIHARPAPGFPSLRARLGDAIARAPGLPEDRRRTLLDGLGRRPDGDRLCHGDFHPWNVLGRPPRALVIDWLDAARGDPAADLCRSFVLLHAVSRELARDYVAAYAARAPVARPAAAAWLPWVAAARLAEGGVGGRDDLLRWALGGGDGLDP